MITAIYGFIYGVLCTGYPAGSNPFMIRIGFPIGDVGIRSIGTLNPTTGYHENRYFTSG